MKGKIMLSLLADALMIATRQQPFHKDPQQRRVEVERPETLPKVR
jgi:hypothetical protein